MLCDLWKNRFSWPEELSGRHITVNEVRTYVSTLRKVSYVQIILHRHRKTETEKR